MALVESDDSLERLPRVAPREHLRKVEVVEVEVEVVEVMEAVVKVAARRTCISLTACCMPDVCDANSPTLCSV